MAFRIIRQRREARRAAKLEEIWTERERGRGKISLDQLQDIYRVYQVGWTLVSSREFPIYPAVLVSVIPPKY